MTKPSNHINNGDELYPWWFSKKAQYKIANLMKHGYKLKRAGDDWVTLEKAKDLLLIFSDGEVYKKVIY